MSSAAVLNAPAILGAEKKSNHRANVVRIDEILPHNNADSLSLVHIGGYQAVIRKGQFAIDDLAVYVQPDSVVPMTDAFRFIWEGHVCLDGTVPEKRRRITVRKFRGEWSEGLLLPISDFPELFVTLSESKPGARLVEEGEDVSDLLGITHYDPDAGTESTKGTQANAPKRKFRRPKTIRGWFRFLLSYLTGKHKQHTMDVPFTVPTYDVEAYKNHLDVFERFEPVVVTEKIHGSNARFLFLEGVMYAGSRTQWKAADSNCVWRKALAQMPWIEDWCRAHEGYALYGEVTPTQKNFNYGCDKGEVKFFLFDVYNPEGKYVPYSEMGDYGFNDDVFSDLLVPVLYYGPFVPEEILKLVDGPSQVPGATHMREGIVIKSVKERHVRGLGRTQLKLVSNAFLERDSK